MMVKVFREEKVLFIYTLTHYQYCILTLVSAFLGVSLHITLVSDAKVILEP
jgi:hypothetical protein